MITTSRQATPARRANRQQTRTAPAQAGGRNGHQPRAVAERPGTATDSRSGFTTHYLGPVDRPVQVATVLPVACDEAVAWQLPAEP